MVTVDFIETFTVHERPIRDWCVQGQQGLPLGGASSDGAARNSGSPEEK